MNPKAMTAMAVRTQARNVRSFAAWSLKFRIMFATVPIGQKWRDQSVLPRAIAAESTGA
jgi:hypothetical protein